MSRPVGSGGGLDKTGTLTTGAMTISRVITAEDIEEKEALLLAGAVEDASSMPSARRSRGGPAALAAPPVTEFAVQPGEGCAAGSGTISSPWAAPSCSPSCPSRCPPCCARRWTREDSGRTAVLAGWDGQARAAVVIADRLKPAAVTAVARLRGLGLRPVLLTGDNERTALTVASQLGIPADSVFAGVGPEGKAAVIRQLQSDGTRAAFVGDGVNDAAALAQADLGLAIGTGTDVAIGAADLTLVSGNPDGIADAIQLSRATMTVIRANLTWAFGYNVIAIPVAALGYLNPLFAGIAMSASSLIVVVNSLRMRRFTPQGRPQ